MNRSQGPAAPFALFAGVFYLVEGVWGLFSPVTFGILSTNLLHSIIHIGMGVTGIYLSRTVHARLWCNAVGSLVIPVGILYFVPIFNELLVKLFNLNGAVATFNIVAGATALLVARITPRSGAV